MSRKTVDSWSGSLHQTSSIAHRPQSRNLKPFLEADGLAPDELLSRLPCDSARSSDPTRTTPDPKLP